jgi:hypothetical protein
MTLDSPRMSMDAATSKSEGVDLREVREQLAAARERLDQLAAEQAKALAALQRAESRRGSLPYRLVAEVRARLRGAA